MDKIHVFFTGQRADSLREIANSLGTREFTTQFSDNPPDISARIDQTGYGMVVVCEENDAASVEMCEQIRRNSFTLPVQLIVIAESRDILANAISSGVDDVIELEGASDADAIELRYRLEAASIRLKNQLRLIEERDFFKAAAKQEEELSSRILDQHLILKQAFRNIEDLNKELEDNNSRLQKIAKYDVLSGLLNRMSLFATIDMEIERALRSKMPLSGILLDIDNFKEINDEYGHLSGDEVISELGRRLNDHLRKYDQAGRYGGEEFFIILPNANLHQTYVIAERFRIDLEANPVRLDSDVLTVTASFGIAEYRHGESRESWIARSDRNMYVAKQSGRNQVFAE